jgi:hypothetical protein
MKHLQFIRWSDVHTYSAASFLRVVCWILPCLLPCFRSTCIYVPLVLEVAPRGFERLPFMAAAGAARTHTGARGDDDGASAKGVAEEQQPLLGGRRFRTLQQKTGIYIRV